MKTKKYIILLSVILSACIPVVLNASVLPLEFSGGNGTSEVDAFNGKAGDGWSSAWASSGTASSANSTVLDTDPLSVGGGNYLSLTATSSGNPQSFYKNRPIINDAVAGIDLTGNYEISFLFRVDELALGSTINVFADVGGGKTGTGGTNTWSVNLIGNGWGASVEFNVGTVYIASIKVDAANQSYVYSISDGVSTYVSSTLIFRNTSTTNGGAYLHFGVQNLNKDLTTTFSIDSLSVSQIPESSSLGGVFGVIVLLCVGLLRRRNTRLF